MKKRRKIPALILTVVLTAVLLTSCGAKIIEIPMFDGSIVEVETKGLSNDQVDLLEQISSGEINVMGLLQGGLFTPEELTEIGFANIGMNPANRGGMTAGGMGIQDFSGIDINTLNLDGLSDEQIYSIENIITGEITIQAVVDSGVMTQQQIMTTGLLGGQMDGNRPAGGRGGQNSGGNTQGGGDNSN